MMCTIFRFLSNWIFIQLYIVRCTMYVCCMYGATLNIKHRALSIAYIRLNAARVCCLIKLCTPCIESAKEYYFSSKTTKTDENVNLKMFVASTTWRNIIIIIFIYCYYINFSTFPSISRLFACALARFCLANFFFFIRFSLLVHAIFFDFIQLH